MEFGNISKHDYGADWQLIFYHNATGKVFFEKNSQCLLFCNETQRFSTLGILTDNFKINGYFEFLIEYPERSSFYRWKQKKNPTKHDSDVGFVPIHVPSTTYEFNGLALSASSRDCTFLEGNIGTGSWYFSIGCYGPWLSDDWFPGPCLQVGNSQVGVSLVKLYVRVRRSISCKIGRKTMFNIFLMIFLLLS